MLTLGYALCNWIRLFKCTTYRLSPLTTSLHNSSWWNYASNHISLADFLKIRLKFSIHLNGISWLFHTLSQSWRSGPQSLVSNKSRIPSHCCITSLLKYTLCTIISYIYSYTLVLWWLCVCVCFYMFYYNVCATEVSNPCLVSVYHPISIVYRVSDKGLHAWKQGLDPFHFNLVQQLDYLQKFNSINHDKNN